MAVCVKLLHIISDNNLITVVHRFLYCPLSKRLGGESVSVSRSSFCTQKTVLLLTPVA